MAKDYRVLIILLAFSLCLLLLTSADGFFRYPSLRGDNAWFYMSGKAWMEGMIPYVDFTDSKGPLIWLIYGLAYLISPQTYSGLFIFEVIAYWLTFYVLFRCANLFLKNKAQSLFAAMTMGLMYFYPGMHDQIRLEDFCQLFHAVIFYVLLQVFLKKRYKDRYAIWMGVCSASLLLMKYSYFLTSLIPAFIVFLYLCFGKQKFRGWRFLICWLGSFAAVCLPFIIYLGIVGAFDDFLKEYFLNTGQTMLNLKSRFDGEATSFKMRWPFKIWYLYRQDNFISEFMRLLLVCFCFTLYYFRRSKWLVCTLIFWYMASVLLFSVTDSHIYYLPLCIVAFGGIIWLVSKFKALTTAGTLLWGGCIIGFMAIITSHYIYNEFYFIERDRGGHANLAKVATIINDWERKNGKPPTITYYRAYDHGEDIATNALPGTKYWSEQAGMTEDMKRHHEEDIFTQRPTFVVVRDDDDKIRERLEKAGYKMALEYTPVPPLPWQTEEIQCLYEISQDN